MGEKIIAADREDIRTIEAEEQICFIFDILSQCGIPEEDFQECLPSDDGMTVQQRIALRKMCAKYDVSIIDDMDGALKIYVDDDVIAEWRKPQFVLRTDATARERHKRLYVEIHCSWWSKFEEKYEQSKGINT